ncbi:hypothetical protein [Thermocatellispora tengchongensis]|uniref:hypothetical protein n=1 Tax=Thermocatellispora tengchongensis TaxID=1073253 RepID=UPI00364089AE
MPAAFAPVGMPDFSVGDVETADRHDFPGDLAAGIARTATRALEDVGTPAPPPRDAPPGRGTSRWAGSSPPTRCSARWPRG